MKPSRRARDLDADPMLTSYFLGRKTLIPSTRPEMGPIEERVFTFMSAGNLPATTCFGVPTEQVVELGTQVEILMLFNSPTVQKNRLTPRARAAPA